MCPPFQAIQSNICSKGFLQVGSHKDSKRAATRVENQSCFESFLETHVGTHLDTNLSGNTAENPVLKTHNARKNDLAHLRNDRRWQSVGDNDCGACEGKPAGLLWQCSPSGYSGFRKFGNLWGKSAEQREGPSQLDEKALWPTPRDLLHHCSSARARA